jgi:hypothetical protein
MISNTPKTIQEIDDLILQLIAKIRELEHDLRFQPHMKHMVDSMKLEIERLFKQHQISFVKASKKGWIY